MKKFKLEMEELQVETFHTASMNKEKGTVLGAVYSLPQQASCNGDDTCAGTCGTACESHNTCDYFTCAGFVSRWQNGQFCVYC